jgi:hypothetical protein
MSYAKLPKVIQDYGIGIETINQAIENVESLRTIYDAEHNTSDLVGFYGQPTRPEYGQHDHSTIPKSAAVVTVTPYSVIPGETLYATRFDITGRVIRGLVRFRFGLYVVVTDPLQKASATATPVATSTNIRMIKVHPMSALSGQSGWIVSLQEQLVAGDPFSPSEFSFHFRCWGQ